MQLSIQLEAGDKAASGEADHLPSAGADVKKMWSYTSIPHTPS
jgi:hypothetical protein